ncbi:glycoside hydrolase/deacetylase [Dentipellis sp. KUC8613]|nr:glycoside hydrolase/deacetylase [Dentipellis sp. KUC8613]
MFSKLSVFLSALSLVAASSIPHDGRAPHEHNVRSSLPSRWYHDDDHPAHALFRRQSTTTNSSDGFPEVGTPTWAAAYPSNSADVNSLPQAWKDALDAAVKAGQIPNIPVGKQSSPGADPSYGSLDPNGAEVCSTTVQCRPPGVIWDAPDGVLGLSFDDGPLPPSDGLYAFLRQQQLHATHFFIGTNILQNPKEFLTAFQVNQDDIAVHTWTHPYMTTLTNEQLLGEFGWTMQIIYNSTGGRLPRYWRPPYGDSDNRVIAIAKEVFGLTTVIWNQDTNDWSLGESGGTNAGAIQNNFKKWLAGPKSPGLIILEHELSNGSVNAFMQGYPLMTQNGWQIESVARLQGLAPYWNAQNSSEPVISAGLLAGGQNGTAIQTSTSAPASSAAQSAPTSSASSGSSTSSGNNANQSKSSGAVATGVTSFSIVASTLGLMLGLILA